MPEKTLLPSGQIWLSRGGENVLGGTRMALLESLALSGSITGAAKAVGISYRTAWEAVGALNRIGGKPLVESAAGGKRGGGTRLTDYGRELLERYSLLRSEHGKYMAAMEESLEDFDRFQKLSRTASLKTTARNQVSGTIRSIRRKGLRARIVLAGPGGIRIRARITLEGLDALGLREGDRAYALVKANWIALRSARERGAKADGAGAKAADWNRLKGRIRSIKRDSEGAEAGVDLTGGVRMVASLPAGRGRELREGAPVLAVFRSEDVILGVSR